MERRTLARVAGRAPAQLLALAWTAPSYRRRFAAAGVTPPFERFSTADVERLPVLAKDDVRRDPDGLCPGGAPGRGVGAYYTSGSSGNLSGLLLQRRLPALVRSSFGTLRSFAGVDYTLPRATFSGRRVAPAATRGAVSPLQRSRAAGLPLAVPPRPGHSLRLCRGVPLAPAAVVTGYAGSIALLARLAVEQRLEFEPLTAVITAAEPVPPSLRADCLPVFGCRVTEEYGLIEQTAFALECEEGSLHLSPDAALVEILDEHDRPCPPGTVGEIVGTSFVREAQPLIRYRTGDLGALSPDGCACGRETPVLSSVEGRVDDVVVTPDGRRVGRLSTVPKNLPGLVACQFVQERPDRIAAHVVCEGELRPETAEALRTRLRERLGSAMEVHVEQVAPSALELSPRGKIRGVVSRIADDG